MTLLTEDPYFRKLLIEAVDADLNEIRDTHYDFVKYNHHIDHVLLNTGTREDLVEQMSNLINYYINPVY